MLRQEGRKLQDTSTSLTTPLLTTRGGYVVAKVNFSCGSRHLIGHIFIAQVISGLPANMKPALIFLLLCMDAVGLPVVIPRSNRYSNLWSFLGGLKCNVTCSIRPIVAVCWRAWS